MKRILKEVQDGTFAKELINEAKGGGKNFKAQREKDRNHFAPTTVLLTTGCFIAMFFVRAISSRTALVLVR